MKWEWQVWRRHWLNWLVLPLSLIFLVASYGILTQQKQRTNVTTINRLVNTHDTLSQNLSDLEQQKPTRHVGGEKKLIRQQLIRLQRYVAALKANRHDLAQRRLAYEQGMLAHPALLMVQSKQKTRLAANRDQTLIANGITASEAASGLSAGEFLCRLQNPLTFGFLLVLVIFSTAGLFTRDWQGAGWKMQYLLPRPRPRLLGQKLALASVVALGSFLVFWVMALIVAGCFTHDFGGWRYPMIVAETTLMPRIALIVLGWALMLAWLVLLLSVVELVGIWLADRFVAVLVLSVVVIMGAILFQHQGLGWGQVLNPLGQFGLVSDYAKQSPPKLVGLAVLVDLAWTVIVNLVGLPIRRRTLLLRA